MSIDTGKDFPKELDKKIEEAFFNAYDEETILQIGAWDIWIGKYRIDKPHLWYIRETDVRTFSLDLYKGFRSIKAARKCVYKRLKKLCTITLKEIQQFEETFRKRGTA